MQTDVPLPPPLLEAPPAAEPDCPLLLVAPPAVLVPPELVAPPAEPDCPPELFSPPEPEPVVPPPAVFPPALEEPPDPVPPVPLLDVLDEQAPTKSTSVATMVREAGQNDIVNSLS